MGSITRFQIAFLRTFLLLSLALSESAFATSSTLCITCRRSYLIAPTNGAFSPLHANENGERGAGREREREKSLPS